MPSDQLKDPNILLEVKNVSKKYCRTLQFSRKYGLKDIFFNNYKKYTPSILRNGEFWALYDISFTLSKGESLGLIGLNGAGKSTLLKLISGLIVPDDGEIRYKGSVGSMIELGTGFHPMLTGRENIYLKGALLGRNKDEMDSLYNDIIDFAEIDDFLDSPLKTYSSGMYVRLGFAIAIHMKPNILLLDEIMAVGDFRFQQKCLSKINEMRNSSSFIFVSHSMGYIRLFCDRAIVLEKGKIAYIGAPDDSIKYYEKANEKETEESCQQIKDKLKPFYGNLYTNSDKILFVNHKWTNSNKQIIEQVHTGEEVNLEIRFNLKYKPNRLVVGVPIYDKDGTYISGVSTDMTGIDLKISPSNRYLLSLNLKKLIINPNEYYCIISFADGPEFIYRQLTTKLKVVNYNKHYGLIEMPHTWSISKE